MSNLIVGFGHDISEAKRGRFQMLLQGAEDIRRKRRVNKILSLWHERPPLKLGGSTAVSLSHRRQNVSQ